MPKKPSSTRREFVLFRDQGICQICFRLITSRGSKDLEAIYSELGWASIDHIIPVSLGGTNIVANLRLAHSECNTKRGNTVTESDYLAVRKYALMTASVREEFNAYKLALQEKGKIPA